MLSPEAQTLSALIITTVAITLSGALAPGPVFAVTLINGRKNKHAGAFVAFGHAIVEVPLIILIALGVAYLSESVIKAIAFLGAVVLFYLGISTIKLSKVDIDNINVSKNSVVAGAVTTATNPYFFIWWFSLGSVLVFNALYFGIIGIVLFIFFHWICDFLWYYFVSYASFKTRGKYMVQKGILIFSGILLIFFGVVFLLYSLNIKLL